jgi:hypothetical protein
MTVTTPEEDEVAKFIFVVNDVPGSDKAVWAVSPGLAPIRVRNFINIEHFIIKLSGGEIKPSTTDVRNVTLAGTTRPAVSLTSPEALEIYHVPVT